MNNRGSMTEIRDLCLYGMLDGVRAALARGGDVNNKNCSGRTALMGAVSNGHNSVVKLLLEQPGVKVNEKSNHLGETALHCAGLSNNAEGARMLLLHPDFNSANATQVGGETALSWAVICRAKELLIELVKHESVSLDLREGVFDER